MNWKNFLKNRVYRKEFIVTIILLAIILYFFPKFLHYVETRAGFSFRDPFLTLFNPVDLTWITFGLIYLSLVTAIILFIKNPAILMMALQCYGLMVVFRIIAMYSTPLDAPATLIPLNDPFVQLFGTGQVLKKDLFFSGHTATLFLLFLVSGNRKLKLLFLLSTIVVGISVLLQHVHYTIDVVVAPFVSYTSYKMVEFLRSKLTIKANTNI